METFRYLSEKHILLFLVQIFLLLVTGFEIRLSSVWKKGKASLTIGTVGVLFPILVVCLVFYWLPDTYWGGNADRLIFTLFLATAAAISAIPVTVIKPRKLSQSLRFTRYRRSMLIIYPLFYIITFSQII